MAGGWEGHQWAREGYWEARESKPDGLVGAAWLVEFELFAEAGADLDQGIRIHHLQAKAPDTGPRGSLVHAIALSLLPPAVVIGAIDWKCLDKINAG